MRASLPCTVVRLTGAAWHFPRGDAGRAYSVAHCGASGAITGLAIGTAGLPLCDRCVEAVRSQHPEAPRP
jgi:hypothetical protein